MVSQLLDESSTEARISRNSPAMFNTDTMAKKKSKTCLNSYVQGDWQAFTCPCERPPFGYRVGCMEQGGNGHKENASNTFLLTHFVLTDFLFHLQRILKNSN